MSCLIISSLKTVCSLTGLTESRRMSCRRGPVAGTLDDATLILSIMELRSVILAFLVFLLAPKLTLSASSSSPSPSPSPAPRTTAPKQIASNSFQLVAPPPPPSPHLSRPRAPRDRIEQPPTLVPPQPGNPKRLNLGEKVGLVFLVVVVALQVALGAVLVFKRLQLRKMVRGERRMTAPSAAHSLWFAGVLTVQWKENFLPLEGHTGQSEKFDDLAWSGHNVAILGQICLVGKWVLDERFCSILCNFCENEVNLISLVHCPLSFKVWCVYDCSFLLKIVLTSTYQTSFFLFISCISVPPCPWERLFFTNESTRPTLLIYLHICLLSTMLSKSINFAYHGKTFIGTS